MIRKNNWFARKNKNLGLMYEQKAVKDHSYFVYVKTNNFLRMAKNHFGIIKKKNCLDVGCGSGETVEYLRNKFETVIGLDSSRWMMLAGKKRMRDSKNVNFITGDAAKTPFKNNVFDSIVLFNVLHHINSKNDIFAIIAQLKKLIRKNGILCIVELNPLNPITRNVVKTCKIDKGVNLGGFKCELFPTTLFSEQAEYLLTRERFKLIHKSYFVFFPKVLKAFLPLERLLAKFPLGGLYMVVGEKTDYEI